MTLGEPPVTPKLRLVGIVWGAVGVVALIIGLIAQLTPFMIFGVVALVLGILVYAAQSYREASAARTRRRMAGGPVSPMSAPAPVPDVGPGAVSGGLEGRPGYRRRPWLRNAPAETLEDAEPGEDPAGDGLSDLETGEEDSHQESVSEADDGTGNTADGEDSSQTS